MSNAEAKISKRRKFSGIWVIPVVAVLIGAWMVVYSFMNEGPHIKIRFSTAEGIEAGKTKIKVRNVEIGVVESAELGEDLKSVVVHANLEKFSRKLLREDTQFWVVRPRVGARGVSGIGTLLFSSIRTSDYPVIQGITLLVMVGVLTANFLVDITYGFIDPRIRAAQTGER